MLTSWFVRMVLCVFLVTTAIDLIRPMVSYRALELGANTVQIGFLAGSYAVLSMLIAMPTGQWVDRVGETRFMMLGGALMAGTALWLAAATTVLMLGMAQALLGAGQIVGLIALQTLVANCSPESQRDAHYGAMAVAGSLGQVTGPALGGFISSAAADGSRTALLTSCILLTALTAIAASLRRWPPPHNERDTTQPRADALLPAIFRVIRLRSMPQAMIASMTVLATMDILVAYVPVYGEANGLSATTVGLLLSTRAAASVLSRLAMVPMLNRLGRRRLFLLGLVLPAAALIAFPVLTALPLLFVMLALAGFGLGLGQPMSLAWVTRAAPADSRGITVGVRLTGNRAGQVFLPTLVGAIGGATGVGAIFVALGVMLTASAGAVMTADFSPDAPTE